LGKAYTYLRVVGHEATSWHEESRIEGAASDAG